MPNNTTSTVRTKERKLDLDSVYTIHNMRRAWKEVRNGLRNQDVIDLHDYFDFHKNKDDLFPVLQKQVTSCVYFPSQPYIIRVEKQNGISRHLQLPTPQDTLVLQTLVNVFTPMFLRHQPNKNAYYSRSHRVKSINDLDESFPYDWRELWPDFQKRIWEFTYAYSYVVVTDIANFFDNISMNQLRNIITSYGAFNETVVDFLFYLLERFIWRPDYLPFSGVGLPQINFDAPRILAHCFLFENDRFLDKETRGDFVRWMDDIDFGVNEIDEGRRILRHLDELLLTRGLRLNTGKTSILSSTEAKKYFLPTENRFLTILSNGVDLKRSFGKEIDKEIFRLRQYFVKFLRLPRVGNWEKVYKRFFTLASKVNHPFLEEKVEGLLNNSPKLRMSIFYYYKSLGYSKKRLQHILNFVSYKYINEDISLFNAAKLIVDWDAPRTGKMHDKIIKEFLKKRSTSDIGFLSSLWIITKYGTEKELTKLIYDRVETWRNSSFLSRQVASVMPRINKNETYNKTVNTFVNSGQTEALSVIRNLEEFRNKSNINSADSKYLSVGLRKVYPLEKYLLLMNILVKGKLNSNKKQELINSVLQITSDPTYTFKLKHILRRL